MSIILPHSQWKSWRDRVRHFTWAWHAVIMGTGVVSALLHLFPYNNGCLALKIIALIFFLLNLALFVFVCTMTVARYSLFPEIWGMMIVHPAQSLFIGCFPMGAATLINAGLNVHQDWSSGGTAGNGFLWALWGFWWLDSAVSYAIAFGMMYAMMIHQDHSLAKMNATWLLPFVPLIVASSTGGLLSNVIKEHSHTLALVTVGFSFTMVIMGLSFALMFITIYCTRLITAGPPDAGLILSAFVVLGPLGQGGFSLLVNGQDLSLLLPLHIGTDFPQSALAGQMIFAGCFIGGYVLWSMGFAWIMIALISIWHVGRTNKLPFSLAYWGLIFPNGTFALLSVQLSKVLDSGFFRAFGAAWSCVVFTLWVTVFIRSIPAFIDGSMFKAPYVIDNIVQPALPFDLERTGSVPSSSSITANNSTTDTSAKK
ncbi:voltage-dependent anion channel [Cytidiella melzeri]|nr:voltage-dependent anion channel [Cytidiella melzeri]